MVQPPILNLFEIPTAVCPYKDIWENKLRLRTIADMISEDGELWTDDQIMEQTREDVGHRAWHETRSGIVIQLPNRERHIDLATLLKNLRK